MIGDAAEAAATGYLLLAGLGHPGMACSTAARPSQQVVATRSRLQRARIRLGERSSAWFRAALLFWLADKAGHSGLKQAR